MDDAEEYISRITAKPTLPYVWNSEAQIRVRMRAARSLTKDVIVW